MCQNCTETQDQGEILAPGLKIQMSNARSRGWCFTINNYTGWDEAEVEALERSSTYGVVGKEIGEQGTPHLQGFVRFEHPTAFTRIKALLTRAHIEPQRGSIHQASEYCKKDGDFHEWGTIPNTKRNAKERWAWIIERAEAGDMDAIKDEYPGEYLRLYDRLRSLRQRREGILESLQNEWWYGPTGTGKSRKIWEDYPNHYGKQLNKWWDGYCDEETVVIEEWCPKNEMTASNLKIWADRYPFNAEIKGGQLRKIRPRRIIITSNYTIDQCFEKEEDREPIKRRFKIVHFPVTPFNIDDILNDF